VLQQNRSLELTIRKTLVKADDSSKAMYSLEPGSAEIFGAKPDADGSGVEVADGADEEETDAVLVLLLLLLLSMFPPIVLNISRPCKTELNQEHPDPACNNCRWQVGSINGTDYDQGRQPVPLSGMPLCPDPPQQINHSNRQPPWERTIPSQDA
jgi:hypothetical protein